MNTTAKKIWDWFTGKEQKPINPVVGECQGEPLIDILKNKFPDRNAKGNKSTTFFPEKVPIVSYERNASEIRIDHWIVSGTNVVRDDNRNKAADIGLAHPVNLCVFGKSFIAYAVDADRGVGVNITLDKALLALTTTAEQAWAFLESGKLAKWASEDLTGRQKLLFLLIGIIIGQVIFYFFNV